VLSVFIYLFIYSYDYLFIHSVGKGVVYVGDGVYICGSMCCQWCGLCMRGCVHVEIVAYVLSLGRQRFLYVG
jgi:hypothetical protein